MRDRDTAIGGGAGRFPDTRHSAVLAARSEDPRVREEAIGAIIAAYWKPAYKYLRIRWRLPNEEAKDAVQGFFASALERGLLERYEPSRGSFRGYLRLCLDSFASNERKAAGRQRRGGETKTLPLEFEDAEGELASLEIPSPLDPEDYFRREWVRSLFGLAVEALRGHLEAKGRPQWFLIFERYEIGTEDHPGRPSYAELAEAFGTTTTNITNHLAAARREFRRILLEMLREITADEAEFHSEARELLGGGD
jgi:DNA-directed RNA polymerase specialized sigma24 family protein